MLRTQLAFMILGTAWVPNLACVADTSDVAHGSSAEQRSTAVCRDCHNNFDRCEENRGDTCEARRAACKSIDDGHEADRCMEEAKADCDQDFAGCETEFDECTDRHCAEDQQDHERTDPDRAGTDCPVGYSRNALGICTALLNVAPEGSLSDDCPAGLTRGPLGDCVLARISVHAVPCDGAWCVHCSPGTKPGPAGGCVLDTTTVHRRDPGCPPGSTRDPNGRCVTPDMISIEAPYLEPTAIIRTETPTAVLTQTVDNLTERPTTQPVTLELR